MGKLLLFIGENKKFNRREIIEKITSIDGVVNPKSGNFIGAVFECDYQCGGISATVRLSDDLETVTVDGENDEEGDTFENLCAFHGRVEIVNDEEWSFNHGHDVNALAGHNRQTES